MFFHGYPVWSDNKIKGNHLLIMLVSCVNEVTLGIDPRK